MQMNVIEERNIFTKCIRQMDGWTIVRTRSPDTHHVGDGRHKLRFYRLRLDLRLHSSDVEKIER